MICKLNKEKEFSITPNQLDKNGSFLCPKCKNRISPDDYDEIAYTILEPIMVKNELVALLIQCNNCKTKVKIMTQESLIDEAIKQSHEIFKEKHVKETKRNVVSTKRLIKSKIQ